MTRYKYGRTEERSDSRSATQEGNKRLLRRELRTEKMKPMAVDYFADLDEQGSTMAMDVDDVEALEIFGEGPLGGPTEHHRLADADFFNSFEDDFDDSDIN
ncbi:PREDICTED: small acidic protein 1 [Ipomoea nil]|uniref:small acidic protein 1 n=1 Tax=Ipomoea nil TaxID=35883 RepID=UPI0009017085|nr:PREDICTED: small acidic protein 1 [Ipomoea nil]